MLGSPDLSLLRFLCLEEVKTRNHHHTLHTALFLVLLVIVVDLILLQETNFRGLENTIIRAASAIPKKG